MRIFLTYLSVLVGPVECTIHVHVHLIHVYHLLFSYSCVAHLLRSFTGSTPFTADSNGFTPLHYAANYGHRMSVQMVYTIYCVFEINYFKKNTFFVFVKVDVFFQEENFCVGL